MDNYKIMSFAEAVEGNTYPGRGIIVGLTPDGSKAAAAYFIMGRSENSRNRIFTVRDGAVFTEPFDISKLEDPSLIIYAAVRTVGDHLIVTNGDQTDTIALTMLDGGAPNFTPRISADLEFGDNAGFRYRMSILKSADPDGTACNRYGYDYEPVAGLGHFIHTYQCDGNPLPTFAGEPERIAIPDSIDEFAEEIWNALDADNKISLYVRYTDLSSGREESRMYNKHQK